MGWLVLDRPCGASGKGVRLRAMDRVESAENEPRVCWWDGTALEGVTGGGYGSPWNGTRELELLLGLAIVVSNGKLAAFGEAFFRTFGIRAGLGRAG